MPDAADLEVVTYDALAHEYYDDSRHPTSAAFRAGSRLLIDRCLDETWAAADVCEVGAGASVVAEIFDARHWALNQLWITDASEQMLKHSAGWVERGAHLAVAPAQSLPFGEGSFDLVAASLGDPYNTSQFWHEARRVLRRDGWVVFTTPSVAWVRAFHERRDSGDLWAMFDLHGDETVRVASVVLPEEEQRGMIDAAGFNVSAVTHVALDGLPSKLHQAPKLQSLDPASDPVVTVYVGVAR
jgi:SAM-dependent methyltransferase